MVIKTIDKLVKPSGFSALVTDKGGISYEVSELDHP
jgi:hypothetical protein